MILVLECIALCIIFTLVILPAQYRDPMAMIISYLSGSRTFVASFFMYSCFSLL